MSQDEIFKFRYRDRELMEMAFSVREEVFIEEQQVPEELEKDEHDLMSMHFVLLRKGKPLAAARYRHTENGVKLERFAVLKRHRREGLGKKILQFVLEDLMNTNKPIYLNAQEHVVDFYSRYGFKKKGKAFYEAGIRHYRMTLG